MLQHHGQKWEYSIFVLCFTCCQSRGTWADLQACQSDHLLDYQSRTYLAVDCPGHGPHSRGKERNVHDQRNNGHPGIVGWTIICAPAAAARGGRCGVIANQTCTAVFSHKPCRGVRAETAAAVRDAVPTRGVVASIVVAGQVRDACIAYLESRPKKDKCEGDSNETPQEQFPSALNGGQCLSNDVIVGQTAALDEIQPNEREQEVAPGHHSREPVDVSCVVYMK